MLEGVGYCLVQSILYCVPGLREWETQRSLYRDGRPERLDRLPRRASAGQDPEPRPAGGIWDLV